ncbi:MAG TPA: type IV toxin-antitoxin system AbiEi family antitoxin domain-containing protein [Pirellulales bacterium]|nr:type IV toxin-antitoxin system AbiEi family antitoxin domain-containing protein [Pirellulales bacterium]
MVKKAEFHRWVQICTSRAPVGCEGTALNPAAQFLGTLDPRRKASWPAGVRLRSACVPPRGSKLLDQFPVSLQSGLGRVLTARPLHGFRKFAKAAKHEGFWHLVAHWPGSLPACSFAGRGRPFYRSTPAEADLVECFQLMEGLANLRPKLVQQLLAACTLVKAKRLFLYLAEKANHQWLRYVDRSALDLGSGSRSLAQGGTYVSKYQLVVPESLATL